MSKKLKKPANICFFYNSMTEEPESCKWGRKVMKALDDAKIEYVLGQPHDDVDEQYETCVYIEFENYGKALTAISKLKS